MTRLWLVLLLLPWLDQTPQQVPTFKAGVEAVRVDVLVTRGGVPVTGLTPADFELLDNGVRQQIDHAAFEEIPLNVVFALDTSMSVAASACSTCARRAAPRWNRLKPEDQAALVTFGDAVVVRSGLTRDRDTIRTALDRAEPSGNTSLVDASETALLVGESQPGRALVVVFSDGIEVSSYLDADAVLDAAKRSDAVVYGVALRNLEPFLHNLTDATGGNLFGDRVHLRARRRVHEGARAVPAPVSAQLHAARRPTGWLAPPAGAPQAGGRQGEGAPGLSGWLNPRPLRSVAGTCRRYPYSLRHYRKRLMIVS